MQKSPEALSHPRAGARTAADLALSLALRRRER
jgi:hypothetical protein